MKIVHVVGVNRNNVIGKGNIIPFYSKKDLKHFKDTTLENICLVGRKTYETIAHLKDRIFIVITSDKDYKPAFDNAYVVNDYDEALLLAANLKCDILYIIGGGKVYRDTFKYADELIVTHINEWSKGNVFYKIPKRFEVVETKDLGCEQYPQSEIKIYKLKQK